MAAGANDQEFREAAALFLQKFVTTIVSILHQRKLIAADFASVTEEDINFIYEVCFSAMANLEDHGGLKSNGTIYYVHLAFAAALTGPVQLLTSTDRTVLHGGLSDEIITAALKAVLPATVEPPTN